MNFDFDTMVDRSGLGNMKTLITDEKLLQKNIPSFSAAEMDFKTAPSIIASLHRVVDRGIYGFTIADQTYRHAVGWWMREMRNWDIQNDWIVPVLGTIFSVATAIRLTTKEGEGVIVQPPVYYRYEQAVRRLNRSIVYNELKRENGRYQMDFDDLEAKMRRPENRLLVLCNPQNPIGCVWRTEDLQRISALAEQYDVTVLSDEIFGEMTFGSLTATPYSSIASRNSITVTSLGKAFNFTGVNHANAIIPDPGLREAYRAQRDRDHYGSVGPFEYASVLGAYCEEGKAWFLAMREYLAENVRLLEQFLAENIPEARLFPVEGTSVCWIDWSFLGLEGEALERFFIDRALFQAECGQIYGKNCGSMTRINLTTPRKQLEDALCRLSAVIEETEKGERA